MRVPPLNHLLGTTRFDPDTTSHIDPDSLEAGSPEARAILAVCPAEVYREKDGRIVADAAKCLECGVCLAVSAGNLEWTYPRGGTGVRFRQG